MTSSEKTATMLDGLDTEARYGAPPSGLRNAVIKTIAALDEAGLLEPRHSAMCQLAIELADSVANGNGRGRASAAAMAAAQLRETLLALPEPSAAGVQEKFEQLVDELLADSAT